LEFRASSQRLGMPVEQLVINVFINTEIKYRAKKNTPQISLQEIILTQKTNCVGEMPMDIKIQK
jgi:hypothetical protein